MKQVAVIGLGDMGGGMALNLIKNGIKTKGFDLSQSRLENFVKTGGIAGTSAADAADDCESVFVMVLNGAQAHDVCFGNDGVAKVMKPGSTLVLTATILPQEAEALAMGLAKKDIGFIDTPVSGGFPGAQGGTLSLMAAAKEEVLERCKPELDAISKVVHHVGTEPGQGQIVKACLQSLIGAIFAGTFEAAALAAKAGVKGQVLYDVISSSGAGCGSANTALERIIDRQFENSGSHIATMHKDLTIVMDVATKLQVPLTAAANAMQMFHAGKSKYPNSDNWVITKILEDIVGAELHR